MSLINPCCGCTINGQTPSNGGAGQADIGFYAWRNANQAITSGLETLVNWTNKSDENPAGIMNLTTEIFTAPNRGRYSFTSGVEMVIAARGSCYLRFYKNGVYQGGSSDEGSLATTLTPNFAIVTWMEVGDTAQIRVFQNSGFAASLIGCCNQLFFSGAAIFSE